MKKYINYILILAGVGFVACDDVIEDDITDDVITTIVPENGIEIEGNTVQFRWKGIEGADSYRIQINEGATQRIILDSLVSETVFDYAMTPGDYQWRIRGENFAYHTAYSFPKEFSIVSSEDLSKQTVLLKKPDNELYKNSLAINYSWEGIVTATHYKFRVVKVEGDAETVAFENPNVLDTSITLTDTDVTSGDAKYIWQVSAYNDSSHSDFFGRVLYLDTELPPAPNLIKPTNNQNFTTGQEVTFSWNFSNDTGVIKSGITATLQVASDENFGNIVVTQEVASEEYKQAFTTTGTYYWRVKGLDAAGNEGPFNSSGVFKVN
ncbi:hypothetical protein ACFSTE_13435 [Aquimarina hainanensis]|uniref:Fibronectin type-III domain-containing protein n=2 Tax=Aquimarina hainanensis TaxID=1578017 RepID=A0ABW5NCE1_9FLAO